MIWTSRRGKKPEDRFRRPPGLSQKVMPADSRARSLRPRPSAAVGSRGAGAATRRSSGGAQSADGGISSSAGQAGNPASALPRFETPAARNRAGGPLRPRQRPAPVLDDFFDNRNNQRATRSCQAQQQQPAASEGSSSIARLAAGARKRSAAQNQVRAQLTAPFATAPSHTLTALHRGMTHSHC